MPNRYYVAPGDSGYEDIYFNVIDDIDDIMNGQCSVFPAVYEGTPHTLWSGCGAYVGTSGDNTVFKKGVGDSREYSYIGNGSYVAVVAYSLENEGGENRTNRILWLSANSSDPTTYLTMAKNGSWTDSNILYNAIETGLPSFVQEVEEKSWDESPTLDGLDPFGSFGGEHADTADWDATDLMEIANMPDPQGQDYSHFITAYALTEANMQSLGLGLFSTGFWTNLKNRFEGLGNPIDFIISAIELPIATFNNYGTQTDFKLGGVEAEDDEGHFIAVSKLSSRYILRNCGTLRLKEVWGTGKDYSDISINIFLPYVGMKELDPDLVVGTDMYLQVQIDCWTGDIVYLLHVDNGSINGKYYRSASVPYRWTGNIATKIPIGKVDNTNAVMSAVNGIISLGGAFAGAAAGAAIGGPAGAAAGFMAGGGANAMNVAQNGFRPSVQSSGGLSGASGIMDYQVAYLIVKRGVPQYPQDWREKIGAMRFQSYLGNQLSGYTLYKEIHLEGMEGAADEEIDQLTRELCSEGIIL